jgi:hypothetical protein
MLVGHAGLAPEGTPAVLAKAFPDGRPLASILPKPNSQLRLHGVAVLVFVVEARKRKNYVPFVVSRLPSPLGQYVGTLSAEVTPKKSLASGHPPSVHRSPGRASTAKRPLGAERSVLPHLEPAHPPSLRANRKKDLTR